MWIKMPKYFSFVWEVYSHIILEILLPGCILTKYSHTSVGTTDYGIWKKKLFSAADGF